MSDFFTDFNAPSIFDNIHLCKEQFEQAIALGNSIQGLCTLFEISYKDLDKWVHDNYSGRQLVLVYQIIKQHFLQEYVQTLQILAARGNNTAMATLNQFIYNMKEDNDVQKVQIVSNVKEDD